MKHWLAVCSVSLAAIMAGITVPALGQAQEDVAVQGEIVDLACYMAKGSRGAAHKACAVMCAKKGVPIGVLTDTGEMYLLLDDHNNPDPYDAAKTLAGERAEISGKKYNKQGVASIVVGAAKRL
jgi:Tfp pilus assembly protein FimT